MAVFVAVAEAGGFAAAARRLGVSAAAVTRAVAALEARLGARLIRRTTRSLRLTEAGRRYRAAAGPALDALAAAERDAVGAAATPRGPLSITAPSTFGRMAVAPLVAAFMRRHPEVTARLTLLDRVTRLVEEGFDLGVRIGSLPDSSLIARRAGETRRIVVASPGYLRAHGAPRTPADLRAHAVVAFTGVTPAASVAFVRDGAPVGVALTPRVTVNDAASAVAMAQAGAGLTIVLGYQARAALRAGRLVTVLDDAAPPPLPITLVTADARLPGAALRAFVDFAAPRIARFARP